MEMNSNSDANSALEFTFNSRNARVSANGIWEAEVNGLNSGTKYNISIRSIDRELPSLPAGPIVVVTASCKFLKVV